MTILGIDPGLARLGYGVILARKGECEHIAHGIIETSGSSSRHERLGALDRKFRALLQERNPDIVAVEELFIFKNVKTAIAIAEARGVILAASAQSCKVVREFTPLQVKQAVTGYGRATKTQVQKMVQQILRLALAPQPDDAADALAVALCSFQTKDFENFRIL